MWSFPPTLPAMLGDPALDRHVDVLVAVGEREAAVAELALDLVQRGVQLVALGRGDDPLRGQHRGVRARLLRRRTGRGASRTTASRSARGTRRVGARRSATAGRAIAESSTSRSDSATCSTWPRSSRGRTAARSSVRRRPRTRGIRPRGDRSARGSSSSGARQGNTACSGRRGRGALGRPHRDRAPRGSWTTNTNQPRRARPASWHGQLKPLDPAERLAIRSWRPGRGRRASRRAARAGRARARTRDRTGGS